MSRLSNVEEAIEEIRSGKPLIVVDDENRENEGDFVMAAEKVTPEVLNFVITHGRGLVCAPLTEERCDELKLDMMVKENTDPKKTAFTISVDLHGEGVSTGISVYDRSKTLQALVGKNIKARNFNSPGHIFPLKAKKGGVLARAGHTEAAVDLAKMAGCQPGAMVVEILNEDGSMARMPDLIKIAQRFDLKILSIEDLIYYRRNFKADKPKKILKEMP
ncbi:3,4-dihydroxy-2-butanone-4-phosphate synthase [Bacteroidetes bacterium endosymbiont of Geopemphigus sp.]|uniref:3,4-dihydroxy-2-butanone-4-phosphate synthase n=1 Tax=Bacteroidetes bacterium endosymbiont of Geopemphigus sp. TaxID=2047937 RepID=UPI000CD1786D|nr:3,4-dihydroxy-2-butanone-4-phosphate synthase [Bacteroidetes bacterium endosymbiont of Geopemphigus sp.]